MTLTSTLAIAETGLYDVIRAEAALAGVPVTLGDPGNAVRPEHVWIAEEATVEQVSDLSSQDFPMGGREELFELNVRIIATRSGDDYRALRDRAIALAAGVETAVREHRTLDGTVEDSEVVRIERETAATDAGRAILTTVVVRARAWLGSDVIPT